jgi:hypothetical protein
VSQGLKGPPVDSASDCCCARSCGKANPTAFAGPECAFFQRPALAGFLPKLGPSLHSVATVILFRSARANRVPSRLTQCINIQITIAITPAKPTTARGLSNAGKNSSDTPYSQAQHLLPKVACHKQASISVPSVVSLHQHFAESSSCEAAWLERMAALSAKVARGGSAGSRRRPASRNESRARYSRLRLSLGGGRTHWASASKLRLEKARTAAHTSGMRSTNWPTVVFWWSLPG